MPGVLCLVSSRPPPGRCPLSCWGALLGPHLLSVRLLGFCQDVLSAESIHLSVLGVGEALSLLTYPPLRPVLIVSSRLPCKHLFCLPGG